MTGFKIKPITIEEPLGMELRRRRESLGWTLQKAARETRIAVPHLIAIENEYFDRLPDEPTRSNFVKNYIRVLGNDAQLLMLAQAKIMRMEQPNPLKNRLPQRVHMAITPRHIGLAGLGIVLLALVTYLGFEVRALRTPPTLTIISPADGILIKHPTVTLQGRTDEAAQVVVNNQTILKESDGNFEINIDLHEGTNIITIEAKRKHSKSNIMYRTVIFEYGSRVSQSHSSGMQKLYD